MFCALHPAYNPQNFAVNPVNFFLDAIEINALLMPGEKMEQSCGLDSRPVYGACS